MLMVASLSEKSWKQLMNLGAGVLTLVTDKNLFPVPGSVIQIALVLLTDVDEIYPAAATYFSDRHNKR